MPLIAPSILFADFSKLGEEIRNVERGGADYIHLDVMDGSYVPNITFGAPVIGKLRGITNLPFDVHLMVNQPEKFITDFVQAGADIITVHAEATVHLHRTIQEIRKAGVKAGVSLNPATPLNILEYILDDLDLILIMSVNPGFGGQNYIPAMTTKIRNLRETLDRTKNRIKLEVDGGVKFNNAAEILRAGADILVVGSDIFSSGDSESRTRLFKSMEV